MIISAVLLFISTGKVCSWRGGSGSLTCSWVSNRRNPIIESLHELSLGISFGGIELFLHVLLDLVSRGRVLNTTKRIPDTRAEYLHNFYRVSRVEDLDIFMHNLELNIRAKDLDSSWGEVLGVFATIRDEVLDVFATIWGEVLDVFATIN